MNSETLIFSCSICHLHYVYVFSSGKAVQYTGEGILDRKSFRVSENPLKATNVLGCGWVYYGEDLTEAQQAGKGYVYFTVNGQKAAEQFDNVPTSLAPFIHLPKKVGV